MIYKTLYKRSVTGKVSTWYAETSENCFRTVSGFSDGQKVSSEWTCCNEKNVGKSNATTAEEQATAEVEAMYRKRQDLGYWDDVSEIDTPVYFKPMLAHDYNDHKDKIKFFVYSQPKLDGVRCIVRSDGMWSRNGKQIISAPHIFEALKPLFVTNSDLVLDGELYAHKDVCDFNTIISCVRKTKPTKDDLELSKQYIQYHIYDLPSHDGVFGDRNDYYQQLDLPICCVKVQSLLCVNQMNLDAYYKQYIKDGYEGQMIRINAKYEGKRSKSLLKRKEFIDAEFTIVGYEEGKGNMSKKIGKLLFKTDEGVEFGAAVNGTWEYLTEIWNTRDELIGKEATVKYFDKTPDGSLRFPKVIQIGRNEYE